MYSFCVCLFGGFRRGGGGGGIDDVFGTIGLVFTNSIYNTKCSEILLKFASLN
jgi:hypothetical protein